MTRLPDTRDHDKPTVPEEVRNALRRAVDTAVGVEAPFCEREEAALLLTNEAVRANLEEDLQALADEHGDELFVA